MDHASSEWSPGKKPDEDDLISILYVDDDPALLAAGKTYLGSRRDMYVMTASCVDNALAILNTYDFDVILSDYQMPGTDGIEFLKILQETGSLIPFLLFTGNGSEEVVIEAINNGATGYIQKGGSPRARFAELEHKIREASRRRRAETTLMETELQFQTLFESSGTATLILENDLLISCVNAEFSRVTGYAREELEVIVRWVDVIDAHEIVGIFWSDTISCFRNRFPLHIALKWGSLPRTARLGGFP
jgi:DNA-binding response OmpR family regulator